MNTAGERRFGRLRRPWRRPGRALLAATTTATLITAGIAVGLTGGTAASAACSDNPVVCENAKTGSSPGEWDITGAGDATVQGFATDMSVNAGATIRFKVKAEHAYTIDIYRVGYYGGSGARKVDSLAGTFPAQNLSTPCVSSTSTKIYDCGTWGVSATWAVPADAVSGVYFARLTRTDTSGASHISFVVRDDASHSDVVFKTSDATWQAYNLYGGADFYEGPTGRATKLSYNRPFATRGNNNGRDFLFSNEFPTILFLERNGYDVTYTTDVDGDRHGSLVGNHRVFLSVGHDEYWSGPQRAAVEAARDSGTNLAFLSGNEVYWKTRWEPSADGADTDHRTLVCYKETWDNDKSDPSAEWTGTWRDPRFSPPANGGRPENALTGTAYMSNSDDLTIKVPAAQGRNRFWRGTTVASQDAGDTATLAPHTIGYESDEDLDNGFRPAGLIRLSTTTGETPEYLRDFGNLVTPDTTTHHLTLYRAASGALVFGAGTIQYAWGLDDWHDSQYIPNEFADERMQQATVNLLADMHAQPATLMSGLDPATASTDTVAPTTTVTSPAASAAVPAGTVVTVSGTATDTGGGVVAGIEVSLDGGTSWHPATGTATWSYSGAVTGEGSATIKARATDDSANLGAAVTRTVDLTGPTSLFGDQVPKEPAADDDNGGELGVKVVSQADGFIKGVRFYKGTGNSGTHKGSLWTAGGDRLATGTFADESATGWQTLTFTHAVPVVAGTTYIASYTAPNGHYAADGWAFSYRPHSAPPLSAPRSLGTNGNGLFADPGQFPDHSYHDTNYYVDVVFSSSDATPPTVTAVTPGPGVPYVPVTAHPTATFGKPVTAGTVHFTVTDAGGAAIGGTTGYDGGSRTATFTPSAALPAGEQISVEVTATDTAGTAMIAPKAWSFTTNPSSAPVTTLFTAADKPATAAISDSAAVSLGVKFVPNADGLVAGVRFFKGSGNSGTHTGSLWSATGTRLATATFADESASGWQSVYFATPVRVNSATTYVASYFAPNGSYPTTANFFTSAWTHDQLTAPAGANGTFAYDTDSFPANSWASTNYWVDPLFIASAAPGDPSIPAGATTMFGSASTPAHLAWDDPAAVEVGMRFSADVAGSVSAVRFFKGPGNTGTHTGTLWTSSGALLASVTFTGESAGGWQTMQFSAPVAINAHDTYVVSYRAPDGHYALDVGGLSAPLVNAPLRTPAGAATYQYGGGFPANSSSHNYWVDVVFTPNS
jgi:N,N-dimethylformamidase beta subunit-like protein/uncharacterized protein DUF4082/Big-like domain-containing protein